MGYFPVRYDSRVVIYDCRGFIRLATDVPFILLLYRRRIRTHDVTPAAKLHHGQCDQIGLSLIGLGQKFSCQRRLNILQLLWATLKNNTFKVATTMATFCIHLENIGLLLIQHLVTLITAKTKPVIYILFTRSQQDWPHLHSLCTHWPLRMLHFYASFSSTIFTQQLAANEIQFRCANLVG